MEDIQDNSSDSLVPGVGLSDAPAVAVFNNSIYVAHQDSNYGHHLYYSRYDGNLWSADLPIHADHIKLNNAPALSVLGNTLYIFHTGDGSDDHIYYTTTTDGSTWTRDEGYTGGRSAFSPTATMFQNTLYVAYHDYWKGGSLWYSASSDGTNWATSTQIPLTRPMAGAPALVAFNNGSNNGPHYGDIMYLLYADQGSRIRYLTFDGNTWTSDQPAMIADPQDQYNSPYVPIAGIRPAVTNFNNDRLYLAFQPLAPDLWRYFHSSLWGAPRWNDENGQWKDGLSLTTSPVYGAALAELNGRLYWFATGENYTLLSGRINNPNTFKTKP